MKTIILTIILFILLSHLATANEFEFHKLKEWSVTDTIEQYDPSNLWEYINGAADLFIAYGFQNLESCEMKSGNYEVVVDVYNMGNLLNAFGMYKTERGEPKEKLNIGIEAVITSPHLSLMLKDVYYVKVNVYEGQLNEERSKNLLNSIAEILQGTNKFPDEFKLLPPENKIKNSEHFAKEGFLGLSELSNCLYADYKINDDEFQFFVLFSESNTNDETMWNILAEKWNKLDNDNSLILYRKIPYKSLVGIIKTEKGILGVTECKTKDDLLKRIKLFYRN